MRDRLSDLPTGILHQILSLLPFDEQVRTVVLSTRWRRLWSTNPVLSLDRLSDSYPDAFVSVVDRCLLLCSSLEKLQSLSLPVSGGPAVASALPRWLRFAADRSVAKLVLRGSRDRSSIRAPVPPDLFDCRDLVVLKIKCCPFPSVPYEAAHRRLHSLKTLVLSHVDTSSDALHALLSVCPSIEHLKLRACNEVSRVAIYSPTMKSLTVRDCKGVLVFEIISALQLRVLLYSGDISKVGSLGGAPDLEEAILLSSARRPFADRGSWRKLLSSIARVKILSVNSWFFQFLLDDDRDMGSPRVFFENLKELHWWPAYKKYWGFPWTGELFTAASLRALISTLRYCPSLELLCVQRNYYWEEEEDDEMRMNWMVMKAQSDFLGYGLSDDDCPFQDDDTWTDPLEEYEGVGFLLPKLKMLKVIEFSGKREETRMVEFLLGKAVALESLVLYYVPERAAELSRINKAICAMPKASPFVRTSLSELPDDPCPKQDTMFWC